MEKNGSGRGLQKLYQKKDSTVHKHHIDPSFEKIDWEKVQHIFDEDRDFIFRQLDKVGDNSRDPQTKEILKLLAAGAVIGLSVFIPVAPMVLAPFFVKSKKYKGYRLRQSLHRMDKQKYVEIVEKEGQTVVRITDRGRMKALSYKINEIRVEKPERWDGKWRVVVFDVPESERRLRDIFRVRLKQMGFYNLQESVWVHPYPCIDQIEFLRQIYRVKINVRYILAESIDDTDDLIRFFHLH